MTLITEKCETCEGAGYFLYGTGDDTVCYECGGIGRIQIYKKPDRLKEPITDCE